MTPVWEKRYLELDGQRAEIFGVEAAVGHFVFVCASQQRAERAAR